MPPKQTQKPSPKKENPNVVLKYSGMVFQIFIALVIAVFIGQKLDAYFELEKPLLTALCAILALPLVLYSILKDLL